LARWLRKNFVPSILNLVENTLEDKAFIAAHRMEDRHFTRRRSLSFSKLFKIFATPRDAAMQTELNQFFRALDDGPMPSEVIDDSTVFKARMKMSPSAFFALDNIICQEFYARAQKRLWNGLRLVAVDGSTLIVPHWPDIANYFEPERQGEPGTACRLARTLECYDVLNGLTVAAGIDPYRESELSMLVDHGGFLGRGDLAVLDRGFAAYWVMAWLLARECHFCVRLPLGTWKCAQELVLSGAKEKIIELDASTPESMEQCQRLGLSAGPIRVRLVRVELPTGEVEVLCTSLLDLKKFPAEVFQELYHMRWPVEEKIKRNKCRAEIENFTGKTARSVMQDFYAKIFTLNLARILAWPAEPEIERRHAGHKYRYQINWASALKAVKSAFSKLFIASRLADTLARLTDWFVDNVEPIRPGRSYPRNHKSYRRVFYINYKSCL
jgi:hypothetical protein